MNTHVIILAQGQQSRLPALTVAKQMLPLPACGGTPILHRTIRQVAALVDGVVLTHDEAMRIARDNRIARQRTMVSVVCWLPGAEHLSRVGVKVSEALRYYPNVQTLRDPGNSSLKGLQRALDVLGSAGPVDLPADRMVVLLGDVVYSWACLRAILDVRQGESFAGTRNLSRGGGELWGVAWSRSSDAEIRRQLEAALREHPPFDDTYQPGQLRRLLWSLTESRRSRAERYELDVPWFTAVNDYTMDIDVPEHVLELPRLSKAAAEDDAREGLTW